MASTLCVILVITTWFSVIFCAPAKNLYPQITPEAFNEVERKLRTDSCFYPADKEIDYLRSNCIGSSDNQLSVCNQTLTLGLKLCAVPGWKTFTGQHINPESLYKVLKDKSDICAMVESFQQWHRQQQNDKRVDSLVMFLTATPLVDVNNCRSTCQDSFNIICQLHGIAVIKLIRGLREGESDGQKTAQQSGVAPPATKSPASGGNLPSGKDSQSLQRTDATGNPLTQPSLPSDGNSNAKPPSGSTGSTADKGGAGNTAETGGAGNTTDKGGAGNTADKGGAGNTADKGGAGNTAETGGAGNTAETGGAGSTADKGGTGNTTETGGAGNTADKDGAGNSADKGGAGNTADKGGAGNTAETGGAGNTAETGGAGNTAEKGGAGSPALGGPGSQAQGGAGSTVEKGGAGNTADKGGAGSTIQEGNAGSSGDKGGAGSASQGNGESTAQQGNDRGTAQPIASDGNEKKPGSNPDKLSGGEGQKIASSLPGTTQAPSIGGPIKPADGVSPSGPAPEGGQHTTVQSSATVKVTPPKPNDKGTLPARDPNSEETLDGTDDDLEGEENGVADQKTSGKGNTAEGTGKGLEAPGDKGQGAGTAIKKETQSFSVHDEELETESSGHFMAYFLTAVVLCIAGYVIFHNKQKIIAFIVEGRSGRQRRRLNGAEYKKLQSNVEEVMPALDKTTAAKNFIY